MTFPPKNAPRVPSTVPIEKGMSAMPKSEADAGKPLSVILLIMPGREILNDIIMEPIKIKNSVRPVPMVKPMITAPFHFARALSPAKKPPISGPKGPVMK